MNKTNLLLGSLSNDLLRLATFVHNDSPSARRFLTEAKRWALQLKDQELPPYLSKIVIDIHETPSTMPTLAQAEKYLMYSVLLQNHTLHS
ncbi:hypothetical protein KBD69_03445 [Candidatus Woesebacteria bacterium]|nr:hypothetical protein [Candidatus Woesebacteria bacterium]